MREGSPVWQCSTFLKGRNRRATTKEKSLAAAKEFAEDWYLTLRGKLAKGELVNEKTFAQAAAVFVREYEVITEGERSPKWVAGHKARLRNYLIPFFGDMGLSTISSGVVQDYRVSRLSVGEQIDLETSGVEQQEERVEEEKDEVSARSKSTSPKRRKPSKSPKTKVVFAAAAKRKPPSYSTLHDEIVCLRLVLKSALRHSWIDHLPDFSAPYKTSRKVTHRAWFSPEEYKRLYEATRAVVKERKALHEGSRSERKGKALTAVHRAEALHDKILFLANTGLRPDEANQLQYRDVSLVNDEATGETILEIEVRGKRGVGYCKSMPGAVVPFRRMVERNEPEASDLVFAVDHKKQFNSLLEKLDLKVDRQGNRRTLYSLRHTYISMRLLEGADIYQIAKNCRTSVEMIEKHYAVHLKNRIDASAINVRKEKPKARKLIEETFG